MTRPSRHIPLLIAALAALAGCERTALLQGSVVDVQGQRLPGVAVTIRGTSTQVITDGRGRYGDRKKLFRQTSEGFQFDFGMTSLLRVQPGVLEIDFMKTGYTTGHVHVEVNEPRTVEVAEVMLYPLPSGKGVFIFDHFRYRDTTRILPRQYRTRTGGVLFGTKLAPSARTAFGGALLISHKLPAYDVRLVRLAETEALRIDADDPAAKPGEGVKETVWAPEASFTLLPVPIDEPEQLLIELRPAESLAPGAYAVHWGAFEGYLTTDPGAYLFRVVEPEEIIDGADPLEGEGEELPLPPPPSVTLSTPAGPDPEAPQADIDESLDSPE